MKDDLGKVLTEVLNSYSVFEGTDDLKSTVQKILSFKIKNKDLKAVLQNVSTIYKERSIDVIKLKNIEELSLLSFLDENVTIDKIELDRFIPEEIPSFLTAIATKVLVSSPPSFKELTISYVGNLILEESLFAKITQNLKKINIRVISDSNLKIKFVRFFNTDIHFEVAKRFPKLVLSLDSCSNSSVNFKDTSCSILTVQSGSNTRVNLDSVVIDRIVLATNAPISIEGSHGESPDCKSRIVLNSHQNKERELQSLNLVNSNNFEIFVSESVTPFLRFEECQNLNLLLAGPTSSIFLKDSHFKSIANAYLSREVTVERIETKGACLIDDLDLGGVEFFGPLFLENTNFKKTPNFAGAVLPELIRFNHKSFNSLEFDKGREPFNYLKNHYESKDIEEDAMFFAKLSYKARESNKNFKKYKYISVIYGILTDYGTSLYKTILTWLFISGFVFLPIQLYLYGKFEGNYISTLGDKTPIWVSSNLGPFFVTLIDMLGPVGYLTAVDRYLDKHVLVVAISFIHRLISSFYIYFFIMWFKKIFRQR